MCVVSPESEMTPEVDPEITALLCDEKIDDRQSPELWPETSNVDR